jgi:predicted oxidoreductase
MRSSTDLADIYGYNKSAELVGAAFQLEPGLREKFEILYKTGIVFPDAPQRIDSSAAYLDRAVRIACVQLNTTYIDILVPHAPDPLLVRPGPLRVDRNPTYALAWAVEGRLTPRPL